MESQFRHLGMQLKLDNGIFYLLSDYTVCKEGEHLTPEQSKMIKHLGIQMDEFKINIHAYIHCKTGKFEENELLVNENKNIEMK
jgi:mRNA turnover protein 4